jgi:signal transduction histidine kinase
MKLVPRSISGQLLVVWVMAMLVTHGIAVFMMSLWRVDNSSIHPISARMIETRVVSAYRVAAFAGDANSLLEQMGLPDSTFRVERRQIQALPMNGREEAFSQDIRKMLDLPPDAPVRVQLEQIERAAGIEDRRNWLEQALGQPSAWELHIEVGLPNGRVLASDHWPILIPAHWNRVLSFSLLVGMIPTTLIAIFFGRRIMRPLRTLTQAANKVSRGEQVILPSVGGPDGVREITQAFNDMQTSLIRFVHGRTMMVAAIGHDLRTPMTSLRIRAELVEDAELRDAMIHTLDEMRVMVEEILKFAKDDVLQEATVEVVFNGLVREVIDEQCVLGREVSFQSELPEEFGYRCRPVHLKRALSNLIDNAARFGPVQVAAREDAERHLLEIEVIDQGPGIPPDQLEQVFEPFARLDTSRSSATGGAGLGLTIAHSCVRAHGGSIILKNRSAGGLCATVKLPV